MIINLMIFSRTVRNGLLLIECRRRHVAVADARDDDALRAIENRRVDQVGAHVRARVDHIDPRQRVESAGVATDALPRE